MELPWDGGDPASPWYILQGLLATELMTGRLQVGDDDFVQHEPANIPVAGDPDDTTGPTYADMGQVMDLGARTTGWGISQVLHRDGSITDNDELLSYTETDEYYIPETGHNIAESFWDFMTSNGMIYENGEFVDGPVFRDAFYAVGFPVTEAYWSRVKVNNVVKDVLIQCFERRCLTYTPSNPVGWKVESGNIGKHYYDWRYNIINGGDEPQDPPVADSFDVSPSSATNPVGETHEITVTVEDQYGEPFEGADVSAEVTDGPHDGTALDPDDASTDGSGEAALSYDGDTEGTDTITVTVDGIDESQDVTKTWVADEPDDLTLTIEPDSPVSVDDQATLTALVEDQYGYPVPNVDVLINSDLQGDLDTIPTNDNGEAIIDDHEHDTPENEVITATEQENANDDTGTITWEAGEPANLMLEIFGDSQPQNEIDDVHQVLATVMDQFDNPLEDVSVTFSINGPNDPPPAGSHSTWYPDNGSHDPATVQEDTTVRDTNSDGEVGFGYIGENVGEDTIRAEVTEDDTVFDTSDKLWCDVIVEDGESIQAAEDNADAGDVICVESGDYERVEVDVEGLSLLAIGDDAEIFHSGDDQNPGDATVDILVDDVTVDGFNIVREVDASVYSGSERHAQAVKVGGFGADGGSGATISNNTIELEFIPDGGDSTIDAYTNVVAHGVGLLDPENGSTLADVTVESNSISDFEIGLSAYAAYSGSVSNVSANFNAIVGNVVGADAQDAGGSLSTVDAEDNWWGAADGPSGDGPGSGDSVTGDIDFDPWLTSDPF